MDEHSELCGISSTDLNIESCNFSTGTGNCTVVKRGLLIGVRKDLVEKTE